MTDRIHLWTYLDEYQELREPILAAVDRVFRSGRLVLGKEGEAFEAALAASLGVGGAIGVGNGTDAIFIALAALGVKAGDEVITVPNTAVPTVSAIGTIGAKPVLVDVGEDCLMNVAQLANAITPHTKAIIPVHLYGQMVDMDPLMAIAGQNGISVVEDCAQSQGASYKGRSVGSVGDAATFSFYPTKTLGAYGDGGAVASRRDDVVKASRSLRFYGMETNYYAERHGYNSRLDEVQAAILSLKLPLLPGWIESRRAIAARYDAAFQGTSVKPIRENSHNRHVYHLYVVEVDDRERVMAQLEESGIGTGICYPWPIHTMRGYADLGYAPEDFPVSMRKASRIMNLPIYPSLPISAVDRVIETMLRICA